MWRPGSKINGLKSPTDVFEKLQLDTIHTVHPSDLVHVIPSITTHRKGMPGCGDLRVWQWTQCFCHSSSVLISLVTLFTTVGYVSYFTYHMLFLCYYTLDKNHLWILSCRCLNFISDTSKHTQNRPRLFNRWLFDLRFMSDTSVPGTHSRGAARPQRIQYKALPSENDSQAGKGHFQPWDPAKFYQILIISSKCFQIRIHPKISSFRWKFCHQLQWLNLVWQKVMYLLLNIPLLRGHPRLRFSPHVGFQTFEAKVPGATDKRGWWVRSWGFLLESPLSTNYSEVTPVVYQWLLLLEPCLGDLHDMHQIHLVII